MIKSIIILYLFSLFFFSCNKEEKKLVIEGELSNLMTPYIIASSRLSDTIQVDTILVDKDGKFTYLQNADTISMYTFYFNDFRSSTVVFSDKGVNKIKMKGDVFLSDLIEVKGGEINNNLTLFKKENETLLKQRSLLLKMANSENDTLQRPANFISEKEETATLNSLNHELAQKVEEFIKLNSNKISSVILINEFFKNNENPETLNRVLEYLEGDALNFPLTYKLKNYNKKLILSAEGAQMPYFKLKNANDKFIESSDFRNKYLLLSFLSSSGDESIENFEILKNTHANLDSLDVEFLSVYIDSDSLPINNIPLDSIPWKVIIEDKSWGSDIIEDYNVHYLPFNILIDPDGKIVTRDVPISDVRSLINKKDYK